MFYEPEINDQNNMPVFKDNIFFEPKKKTIKMF